MIAPQFMPEIEAIVVQTLSRALKRDVTDLPRNTSIDDLGMDSLALIGMLGEIEEAFDIELDDAGIRGTDSISSIAFAIEAKLGER